jgi:orotate phosphoribosyltransferase
MSDALATEALLSSLPVRRGHFRYESGHHSDFWMDLETLCMRPTTIQPLATQLAARLQPYGIDAVCGPLNEGAFVALMVASALEINFTYAEPFAGARDGLFPVEYRLPATLHPVVRGARVAIVNDVISAGSAVRGTCAHLDVVGARVVAIGSLLVLGESIDAFARARDLPVEALARRVSNIWTPAECPLCRQGVPLDDRDRM